MAGKKDKTPKSAAAEPTPEPRPAPPAPAAQAPEESAWVAPLPFPVVGVGASAGGLEAGKELLRSLPADTGMALVMIQHLDPIHESMLTEIFSRATGMPVTQVADQMPVEPNHVYVIPPGVNMLLSGGVLHLSPRHEARGQHRPIDSFLRSLAADQKHLAIGVILSGSATDGTLGLEEVKAEGGITFAQDASAEHDSMPRSAIAAGCVDFVLAPKAIAEELARIGRHPYVAPEEAAKLEPTLRESGLAKILELLRNVTGVDFTNYKYNTLYRRIARRMVLHKVDRIRDYARLLQNHPGEVEALYQDILISVTSFFRNPDAFDILKGTVFPKLIENRPRHEPVRIWVVGCSTGEEAYSVAIAFGEFCDASGRQVPAQIFGTDLNLAGIERARAGVYSRDAVQDLPSERLRRFFVETDGIYRVAKSIREACIFARHNVLTEPPFSRIDLVCCRNLLIYLEPPAQQRLVASLHYALRSGGFLWLGSSETIAGYRDLFELQETKHKIYSKRPGSARLALPIPLGLTTPEGRGFGQRYLPREPSTTADLQKETDRLLLARYAPPAVLVNSDFEILQFRGETGLYLSPAPGRASLNLLKMLREGLLLAVRGALQKAKREERKVREEALQVKANGGLRELAIEVAPLKLDAETCFLVSFETTAPPPVPARKRAARRADAEADRLAMARQIARLTQELAATREYLQSVIEQQEAANEELQSANEEVQSANEELQSINEELETSKEEIESSNEELATVNEELQHRNLELSQSNNDLVNLLASAQLPVVMLGPDLRIRRFTQMAEKGFNLIRADIGRPLADIRLNLDVPDLDELLHEVIETVSVQEREIRDAQGRWYSLRLRPYRTLDNKIEGVVVVLLDVDTLKRDEQRLRRQAELLDQAYEPILMWDFEGETITYWNRGAEEVYGYAAEAALGRKRQELLRTNLPSEVFRQVLESVGRWSGELTRIGADRREIVVESRMSLVEDEDGTAVVLETDIPVTHRKRMEEDLRQRAVELTAVDQSRNQFLAVLAHELRNPLAPLRHALEVLKSPEADENVRAEARELAERQTQAMARLVDDLLDVARITHDRIQLRPEVFELSALLVGAAEVARHATEARGQTLAVDQPAEPVYLLADPSRMEQVIVNLLDNASKFTPLGGHIWLTAEVTEQDPETEEREVTVRVRDDGMGIEAARLGSIFDRFLEVDARLDAPYHGLGIGLRLVRRLVELHGGRVEARSAGPNRGSEFVVTLPLPSRAALMAQVAEQRPMRMAAKGPPQRVLVVDDNLDSARSLALLLRVEGHEVETAHDAAAALAAAARLRPQVVLLDIGLPGKDGYQLVRELREARATRDATIVAVTGYGRDEDRRQAREAGFDLHLTKPVEPAALAAIFAGLARRD